MTTASPPTPAAAARAAVRGRAGCLGSGGSMQAAIWGLHLGTGAGRVGACTWGAAADSQLGLAPGPQYAKRVLRWLWVYCQVQLLLSLVPLIASAHCRQYECHRSAGALRTAALGRGVRALLGAGGGAVMC